MTLGIEEALERLFRDLVAEGAVVPQVDPTPWQWWPGSESVMLWADDGSGMGVWMDLSLPDPEALVQLADQVQDWAVEELARRGRPTNWPTCPAHPTTHPCRPRTQDDVAVWACPLDEAEPRVIGETGRP